jgi:AcrR family transcriptional regulator
LDAGVLAGGTRIGGQTIEGESTIPNYSQTMSGSGDRRVRKTREAINTAFSHLMFTREFDGIRIEDILATANVARSTFYHHYRGKDDVLCAVMGFHILDPLSRAGLAEEPSCELLQLAGHVWENRRLARSIFWGSTKAAIVRNLASRIEQVLDGPAPASGLPLAYIASTVAHWQIASLEEWLLCRHRFDPKTWADSLCRGTASLTFALIGGSVD